MPGASRLSFILPFLVWSLVHFVEIFRICYMVNGCFYFEGQNSTSVSPCKFYFWWFICVSTYEWSHFFVLVVI
jgi:hypothetical protein